MAGKNDGGVMFRRHLLVRLIGSAMLFAVTGCDLSSLSGPGLDFCKRENRRIPDDELKARLLLAMRKELQVLPNGSRVRGGLPEYLEQHLAQSLPKTATDSQILKTLQSFVAKNPLCCQFNTADMGTSENPYTSNSTDGVIGEWSRNPKDETYFANFYVLYQAPFSDISMLNHKNIWFSKLPLGHRKGYSSLAAAYSCGYADIIGRSYAEHRLSR